MLSRVERTLKARCQFVHKSHNKRKRVHVVQEISLQSFLAKHRLNLKARAITSNESFWHSESPASRFHSKKRLAFYPSISPSRTGDRISSEEASAQETVDFQRNCFGFPSVDLLTNLPQRSPFPPPIAFSCERELKYWPFAILFARVFVLYGRGTPIDRWMARLGRRTVKVKREDEWPNLLSFFSLSFEGKAREISVSKYKGKLLLGWKRMIRIRGCPMGQLKKGMSRY